MAAGAARWRPGRTLGVLALANAALGAVYAGFGATGRAEGSPTLLVVGSVVVPGLAGAVALLAARRRERAAA